MSRRPPWLALAAILLFCSIPAGAVEVPEESTAFVLGPFMEWLADEAGGLSPAAAMAEDRYRTFDGDSLTLGFTDAVLWARVRLVNSGSDPIERVLRIDPVRLEQVSLFAPDAGGGQRRLDNGVDVATQERPVPGRVIAFPLVLPPGETVLYLRVQSRTPLWVKPVLWQPRAFATALHGEDLLAMLGVGMRFGLALYVVALFPLQRDKAALFLGASMLVAGIFELAYLGYGYDLLWPRHPDWAVRAPQVLVSLLLAGLLLFICELLAVPLRIRRWLSVLWTADIAVILAHFVSLPYERISAVLVPNVLLHLLTIAALAAWFAWRGDRPARLLLLGMSLPGLAGLLRVGEAVGWLPVTFVSSHASYVFASYFATLFFFLSVSQRVDLLEREKRAAQAEALRMQTQAAARLEAQVAERTRELSAAKERAERSDRAKGELLARVSHELRTPLQSILGYAHLLCRQPLAQGARERLGLLAESGEHLAGLIDDLLDFTRGERGGYALEPRAIYLHRLLSRLREQGATIAAEGANQWQEYLGEDLPSLVRADARRVEQVLLVLLSNAGRYTRGGTIELGVAAKEARPGRTRLHFEVSDTGRGIGEADLERIFEPFERASPDACGRGLGLGLPIARRLVRAMGGELRVDSRIGAGSRFWFEVELELAAEDEVPACLPDLELTGYEGPQRTLLVVDDHPPNRKLLEELLSELGFTVLTAGDLREALPLVRSAHFHLALLDQALPDGTAWDLLQALRERAPAPPIPAALLSAAPAYPPPGWGDGPTFDAVLLKPAMAGEVLEVIARLLGLRWLCSPQATPGAARAERPVNRRIMGTGGISTQTDNPDLAALADLAQQGAVYEIETWIEETLRAHPLHELLCREVQRRLSRLDFPGIALLAAPPD